MSTKLPTSEFVWPFPREALLAVLKGKVPATKLTDKFADKILATIFQPFMDDANQAFKAFNHSVGKNYEIHSIRPSQDGKAVRIWLAPLMALRGKVRIARRIFKKNTGRDGFNELRGITPSELAYPPRLEKGKRICQPKEHPKDLQPSPATSVAPKKRKPGRPRKNPLPETKAPATVKSSPQSSSSPLPAPKEQTEAGTLPLAEPPASADGLSSTSEKPGSDGESTKAADPMSPSASEV